MRVSPCYVSVKRIRYSHIIYLLHKGLRISLNLNENYVFMAHLNKYKKRTERMFVWNGRRKSFRRANVKWCEKMSIKVKLVRWVFYFLYGSYRYTHTPDDGWYGIIGTFTQRQWLWYLSAFQFHSPIIHHQLHRQSRRPEPFLNDSKSERESV